MSSDVLTPENIETLFTHKDGFMFARWGRPIAPVVFGIDDASLDVLKDAMARTVAVTGGTLAETDPELGANFMWFFTNDWDEILAVPDLEKLIPNLPKIIDSLKSEGASQYRTFTFDADGAIKFCVTIFNMSGAIADVPIQILTTGETFQCLALWSNDAFANDSPIGVIEENGLCVVKPDYASLLRAAYDPVLPVNVEDPAQMMRVAARAQKLYDEMMQ